jgi:predicted negative regulator of RcsB-dependent stress response
MKKIVLIVIVFVVAIAVGVYFYMYKEHRNIADEDASFSLTVAKLETEFTQNDSLANKKYLDQTIEIYGKISSLDLASNAIVLDEKMFGTFQKTIDQGLTVGKQVKMKGRFIGYDDLLGEFKMDQVAIIE